MTFWLYDHGTREIFYCVSCQVWDHLLPIKISNLENHSLQPYFGFVSWSFLSILLYVCLFLFIYLFFVLFLFFIFIFSLNQFQQPLVTVDCITLELDNNSPLSISIWYWYPYGSLLVLNLTKTCFFQYIQHVFPVRQIIYPLERATSISKK